MHGLMDVGRPLIVAVSTNGCERGLGLLDGLHALYFFSHALRVVMQQMGVKSAPKPSDHHISRNQLSESK